MVGEIHSSVFVDAECVIGQDFHALNVLHGGECVGPGGEVIAIVGDAWNENVSKPHGAIPFGKPAGGEEGVGVVHPGQGAVFQGVDLLDIEEYEV